MSTSTRIGIGIVLFAGLMTATLQTTATEETPAFAAASPSVEAAVATALSTGDAAFIKNAGQWDAPEIRYALDSHGVNVGLTDAGPRFQIFMRPKVEPDSDDRSTASGTSAFPSTTRERGEKGREREDRDDEDEPFVGPRLPEDSRRKEPDRERASKLHEFGIVFDGAAETTPQGRKQVAQTYNYLVGGPDRRRENVPAYASVWYEGLYPGIDLELRGRRSGLKYNFHVAPGADPSAIRIRYEGVEGIALAEKGTLKIDLDEGWDPLTDSAPYIYQLVDGKKVSVAGRYEIVDDDTCGFAISGTYDAALPLVIDPAIAWGDYLGGGGTAGSLE